MPSLDSRLLFFAEWLSIERFRGFRSCGRLGCFVGLGLHWFRLGRSLGLGRRFRVGSKQFPVEVELLFPAH